MADAPPVGYLVINVLEAAGHNQEDEKVWEPEFRAGYARVEIRGGAKTIKKLTSTQGVVDNGITWVEQLSLEVLEGASELRIMLCRPKDNGVEGAGAAGRSSSTSIVAACGIYMKDILEAAPVDKYFELYRPGGGAAGGFIRVAISFLEPDQVRNGDLEGAASAGSRGTSSGILGNLLRVGVVAAGVAAVYALLDGQGVLGGGRKNKGAAAMDSKAAAKKKN